MYEDRLKFAFASKQSIKDVLNLSIEDFLIAKIVWNKYVDEINKDDKKGS